MPRAHYAALERRECRFNRVGGDAQSAFVSDVFFRLVIDRLVFAARLGSDFRQR
jgi:hypothetical protein